LRDALRHPEVEKASGWLERVLAGGKHFDQV